ncbi:hypothetical protein AMJ39_09355 [candidate division TA06 bacterium DG_24]|jgi:hypothetical protein|uniref:Uncharacterized protein n=2 Tax=Bacteria division TA06 TaxID=1156500 RepID=A0A0S8G742_UNCT6|nr:MAG: hypothetical protein AMJ39_09355 [candidate division TA06 bacterium DG_24]KPK67642.1 MAG: hypothetical protein AMJ82_10215 [candidate division TA06 bacterium SM23_40]
MFGSEPIAGYEEVSPERRDELLDKLARMIVERGLVTPAIFLLESMKPLSFIGSQVLVFLEPMVKSVFTVKEYDEYTRLLEDRSNVERLLQRIEGMEDEARRERARRKKERKAEKEKK